jgi:hypothetical protein
MSEFMRHVEHQLGHDRVPVHPRITSESFVQEEPTRGSFPVATSVKIGVGWEVRGFCQGGADIERFKRTALERLRHDVYGDIISSLLDLDVALYDRDFEACRDSLQLILREVKGEVR